MHLAKSFIFEVTTKERFVDREFQSSNNDYDIFKRWTFRGFYPDFS